MKKWSLLPFLFLVACSYDDFVDDGICPQVVYEDCIFSKEVAYPLCEGCQP